MKQTRFFLLALLSNVFALTYAQALLTLPYSMGFEDAESAELSQWHINPINPDASASDFSESWVRGDALRSEGDKALYISDDGLQARYGVAKIVQYAYRDIVFPSDGFYDISFDWYSEGSELSTLSMGLCLKTRDLVGTNQSGELPAALLSTLQVKGLHGSVSWHNENVRLSVVAGREYRLYFVWTNNNQDAERLSRVSAAIDNVQINSSICGRPRNLTATELECGEVELTWEGSSAAYELEYRTGSDDGAWHVYRTNSSGLEGYAKFTDLKEGVYDFRVRGVCAPDLSGWTYLSDYVVFCPEKRCINFVDLHNSANVTCTYGTTDHAGYDHSSQAAYENVGVIDYGPDMEQRHKVIWDTRATDERTNNKLKQVAPGEFASVRLGNWQIGRGAESVSYRYTVDAEHPILLLNYAIVLQDPKHNANEQPRFVLEILNKEGQLIDPSCGYINFAPDGENMDGWQREGGLSPDAVVWKDWSTIGLNLEDYAGEEVRVRVTTYDCFESQHYGYAYFSMGCTENKIDIAGCSGDERITLTAPVGFKYRWRNRAGIVVGLERTLTLRPDATGEYTCHLTNKENSDCGFDLKAVNEPREAVPAFEWSYEPADCQNVVRFTNKSVTRTTREDESVVETPGCEMYEWVFGYNNQRDTETNPVFTYPSEGGTFAVTLFSYIGGGSCSADTTITITLPAIGDSITRVDSTIYRGEVVEFGNRVIGREGEYEFSLRSVAGCDSTLILTLHIIEPEPECAHFHMAHADTICQGAAEAVYVLTLDSGALTTYSVRYDSLAHAQGFVDVAYADASEDALTLLVPATALPNRYTAEVRHHNYDCGDVVDTVVLIINYPETVLYTRFNQVVSLKNAAAAGYGAEFVFTAYQWYLDGAPIEGATESYYYHEPSLETGDYTLELHRADGVTMFTCPLTVGAAALAPEAPSVRKVIINGQLRIEREGRVYTILGL